MYCPKCGKEVIDENTKFCPGCGAALDNISSITPTLSSPNNGVSTALLLVCVLCAIVAIAIPVFCYSFDDGWSGSWIDWFYDEGGIILTIVLGIVAIGAGIMGIFTRKR